jgi:hypothetical protein
VVAPTFRQFSQNIALVSLDFLAQRSMYRPATREEKMAEVLYQSLHPVLHMIAERLQRSHGLAHAAECCSATGNQDGASRMLMDIEQDLFEATHLLNAISIIRREMT